jgi:hypothetical protein
VVKSKVNVVIATDDLRLVALNINSDLMATEKAAPNFGHIAIPPDPPPPWADLCSDVQQKSQR